jgi:hypothetical protein
MRSNNLTLGQILTSPSQYVIPAFQRYYRWDQPQWDKLWDDLSDLQQPGKTGRHFLGFLVLILESVVPGQITRYHLIDGQQRLTTLSLLLCALRDKAKASGFQDLARKITFTTLEHEYEKGSDRYRLFPKLRDRHQYISCLGSDPPAEGRLGSAVRYFSSRLTTIPAAGTEEGLQAFFALLTQRLEFIHAQLEGENPFNIFKSLNSTGVPLGQADLIRNFVFMQVSVQSQDDFEETLWKPTERRFEDSQGNIDEIAFSAFLRDYLMRNGQYIPPSDTFECFQRHYAATDFDPMQIAIELKQASQWYEILKGHRPDPNPEVEEALGMLRRLESSTTYALLLNLYQRRHLGHLTNRELADVLRLLSGFILRRLVCGENSRAYARMFIQAISTVGDQVVDRLSRFLEARDFPDTPRFVDAFPRFNLYGSRYRKVVLEAIERANPHKEPADLTDAQVEHIMPQTLSDVWRATLGPEAEQIHAVWLHTSGNLTLTGYNAELHNRPFAEKRQEYRCSNIGMTRQLAEHESWGEREIRRRAYRMAQIAAELWPGPAATVVSATGIAVKEPPTRFELRRRYWTGLREHLAAKGSTLEAKEPNETNALRCGMIGTGVALYAYFSLKNKRLTVSAQFYGNRAKHLFQTLHERREELEAEIGAKLVWSVPGKDSHYREILLRNPVNPTDESLWPSYFDWMRRSLENFERVIGPMIPSKSRGEREGGGETPKANVLFRVEYWTAFRDYLIASGSFLKPRKPLPEPSSAFGIGRSGITLAAWMNRKDCWIGSDVIFHGTRARATYSLLENERASIEAELGETLEWQKEVGDKHSRIRLRWMDCDPSKRENWTSQHTWLREKLEAFHRVIVPRILTVNTPLVHAVEA